MATWYFDVSILINHLSTCLLMTVLLRQEWPSHLGQIQKVCNTTHASITRMC